MQILVFKKKSIAINFSFYIEKLNIDIYGFRLIYDIQRYKCFSVIKSISLMGKLCWFE